MQGPEKNSYKEFDNEKKFLQLENSPPPHNFSNGPSLIRLLFLCEYFLLQTDRRILKTTLLYSQYVISVSLILKRLCWTWIS